MISDCNMLGSRSNEQIIILLQRSIGDLECLPGDIQPCGQSDVGACQFGTRTCEDTYLWSSCVGEVKPSDEICDNIDNNCNGVIDDGLTQSTNEAGACSDNTETCESGI